ncbi:hypothetical protein TTHERM_00724780 (macronuclear) [Tetrahymena thermophila SB210]|uniref:Uncharacterized protein n=1 Tax=Tetrahymena thermophila (strain SB210) TaxID=312017 RepID=Q24GL3_TETTS|nr:hypothetical protein TTHERM_00724780 [Tetrahymena thermophila SB210]EAS06858.1 hypothetical protein TTHERM_00724780 [Tetrahymena thermophila SB210]|eukprot:XP_001027100.1 hypothetical protein TTHERM_00724780 [Tetrahymena thermophila SB210]
MDFYSSYYTIPRDDSMSSSLPENEMRTPSNKQNHQLDLLDCQCHQNPTEIQIVYSLEKEGKHEQNKNGFFAQNNKIMLNQNYISCNYQDLQINETQEKVLIYDALNGFKSNSIISNKLASSTISSYQYDDTINNNIVKKSQLKSKNEPMNNQKQQFPLNNASAKLNFQFSSIQNEQNQSDRGFQQINQNNLLQLNYQDSQIQKTDSSSHIFNLMNECKTYNQSQQINQFEQRRISASQTSQIHQDANNFQNQTIQQQNLQIGIKIEQLQNSSNLSITQNQSYSENEKVLFSLKNNQNQDKENKYQQNSQPNSESNSHTTLNQDTHSYSEQYQLQQQVQSQLIEKQQEQLSLRDFSYVNIYQYQNKEATLPVENKILLEGSVIVDLNEFINPSIQDSLSKTISQYFYIDQLQKFKKYIVANLQLKSQPETEISKVIATLNQCKENEKAINLIEYLQKYTQFLEQRKQQQQQEQMKITNSLHLIDDSALKLNESQMHTVESQKLYNTTIDSFSSTQNMLTSASNIQPVQNSKQGTINFCDPYSSVQRTNFNLSQANKILKQFEKYCYTFRIIRKSPAQIESHQVGVSNSFIEMIGCDVSNSISSILRNDSSSMLPFDYAGYSASDQSIDQIYEIITPFKEKQKHYNRKQSLKYGEIKHSCGKNIKVKIQQKVFLLSTYQSFDQKQQSINNQIFCEENIGDYLEIKLYTPETLEIQKISKKRTSSSRKGIIAEEQCLEIDQNESKKIYSNYAQKLIDKYYSDETLLSPELIFKKKWTIKSHSKRL